MTTPVLYMSSGPILNNQCNTIDFQYNLFQLVTKDHLRKTPKTIYTEHKNKTASIFSLILEQIYQHQTLFLSPISLPRIILFEEEHERKMAVTQIIIWTITELCRSFVNINRPSLHPGSPTLVYVTF